MLYNLKNLRLKRGLTLEELSKRTGISKTYLNNLENLKSCNPSYKIMKSIIRVLKTTVEELEEG